MSRQISMQQAQRIRAERGWSAYAGPRLEGARWVIDKDSDAFPKALKEVPKPPEKLFGIGCVEALQEGLAVIGARKATPYGLACAEHFGEIAASRGITIIAGGALGCDSQAHRAALKAAGNTVVFLGGGCDQLYPARNHALFEEVIDSGGAVVSEHTWDFPPLPYTFRSRNRLIAGLAKATLIVEAGLPSGTFSTADEALDADKEVWVIPGAITSKTSAGANRLLYQGAYPIVDDDSFDDALSRTFCMLRQESVSHPSEAEGDSPDDALLQALRAAPMRMDELLEAHLDTGGYAGEYQAWINLHLAELEQQRLIMRYPDGRYGPASI